PVGHRAPPHARRCWRNASLIWPHLGPECWGGTNRTSQQWLREPGTVDRRGRRPATSSRGSFGVGRSTRLGPRRCRWRSARAGGALGEVLAEEPIGVLVGRTLPRGVRVAEVHI